MPITAVEPRRLYRQVAEQLRGLIRSGEFAVGARLPSERDLALQLGVSRPTVREALIALEVDGLVRIRVGSGVHVLAREAPAAAPPPPVAGPFEILAARALLEGAVAAEVARVAGPDDLARLDAALDEMRGATLPVPEAVAADRAFHVAVADILRNDAVTAVVRDLFDQRINPYFAQLARYFERPGSWRAATAEHEAIRDAIARGDPEGAAAAMRAHLAASQARFSQSFGGSGRMAPETASRPAAKAAPARRPTTTTTTTTPTRRNTP